MVGTIVSPKVAVTVRAWLIVTTQVSPVAVLHAPPQPWSSASAPAVAVSVTLVPPSYCVEQVDPQSMPVGFDVTVPLPVLPDWLL